MKTTSFLSLQCTLFLLFIAVAGGAVFFDDNFNGPGLNPNLQDPQVRFVIAGGNAHLVSSTGTSDRAYLRTVATDWTITDFVFEITLNSPLDTGSIMFVGIGSGDRNTNYQNEPDNSLYLRIHSPDFIGGIGDNRGRVDVATLTGFGPAILTASDFGRLGTNAGVHRIRMTKAGNSLTFAIDKDFTGVFSADMSYTVSDISIAAPFVNGANSRLFFGSARTSTTWDDLSITAPGSSGGILLYEGFDYGGTAGSLVGKGTATDGWSGSWQAGINAQTWSESYEPTGLTFSTLPTTGGYAAITADGTPSGLINMRRPHNASVTGTLYGSYLYRAPVGASFTGLTGVMEMTPDLLIHASDNAQFSIEPDRYNNLLGSTLMDLDYGSSAGTAISANETYLVLFKVTNLGPGAAIHEATMWILRAAQYDHFVSGGLTEAELNAALLGFGPTEVLQRAVDTTGSMVAQFASGNMLMMHTRFGAVSHFDELRISNTSLNEAVALSTPSAPVKLTTSPYNDTVPKWHPTNGKIAYHRLNATSAMEIGSVNSDGTNETLMVSGLVQPPFGYTTLISWLGSTSNLLCVETNTFHELLAFNTALAPFTRTVADGDDAAFTRKLFVPGGRHSNCFVASRDGNTVAWRDQPNAGGANTLTIRSSPYIPLSGQNTDAFGTVVLTATDPSIGTRGMALSPDGTQLVISMPSGPGFDLWLYNTTGIGAPVQLTTDGIIGNLNLNADISPGGTKILYQNGTALSGSADLWLMNIDGSGKTNITQTAGVDESAPSWGPDGLQYAFARIDGAESNIYRASLAGGSPPSNANLSALSFSAGTLTPAFSSGTISYTASVSNATTSLTVTPTVADGTSTVTVNSIPVLSGTASAPVNLNVGNNTITTVVTALGGGTQTYTVVVNRAPSTNANLANLQLNTATLSPVFASGTLSYTASVPNATTSLTVTPTVQDSTATVKVNNVTVTSGSASGNINLIVGNNTITTVAKAQDGTTTKTYTVVVTRAPSSNANLANLTQNTGSISPVFASGTLSYTSTVAYPVATIRITPTVQDSTATVKVNNVTVASGSASGNINLAVGPNIITTVVKAQDAATTQTYTLTITRTAPSTNANLAALSLSAATISPVFDTSTTSYTASVPHLTFSTTVTPTVQDATATAKVNGSSVSSGVASGAVALTVGANTLNTVVTAEDGVTKKTYSVEVTRAPLVAVWNAATDIPLTIGSYEASGAVDMTLNFAPQTGTTLTVVKNTGLAFITGRFTNLAQGQAVTLTYNGIDYEFIANYFGGTGNDLVLMWANVRLMSWGSGITAALGQGTTFSTPLPDDVDQTGVLLEKTVIAAVAGGSHSLAVCSDGTLASWGDNLFGQLGDNTTTQRNVPVAVNTAGALSNKTVIAVSAGSQHSMALCSDGTVATWGDNAFGQLGDNTTNQRKVAVAVQTAGVLSGKTVIAISAGQFHSLALCSDGTVASWGANFNGQLGDNTASQRKVPVAVHAAGVLSGKTVIAISAGQFHNLALCSDGTVAAWGVNLNGQLGNNNIGAQQIAPVAVVTAGTPLAGKTVTAIAAGGFGHSLALCSDGTLAAWGANNSGQLGNGSTTQSNVPTAVNQTGVLLGKSVVALSSGSGHALVRCSDGTLVSWGQNNNGQLGNNGFANSLIPVAVNSSNLAVGDRFTQASTGGCAEHNLALVASPAPTGPIPIVTTLAATAVTSTSATLNGTVNANGSSTDVSFNYGVTALYGTTVAGTPTPVTGSSATAVSANLSGLVPGSTYHFRVRGVNGNGTKKGSDLSFSTPSNNANLNGLVLSSGTLGPTFTGGTTGYTATVPNATLSVTFTPTVAESHATVTVDGNPVASGNASGAINLVVGDNTIVTVVTAQDGTTLNTYTVVVTRLPISNNANLADLSLSKGTLSPVFSGGTIAYSANVSTLVSSLTVTPTVADSGASVKVNNITVDPGDSSGPISLIAGANTITVEVTAENGTTTKSYAVEVTRGVPSNNANLSALTLSAGILAPSFSSGTTDYSASVVYETSSITVTPTVADGTATVEVNGTPVASVTPSGGISLAVGGNPITIDVTAEDGSTTKSYTVIVTRLPKEFLWGGTTGSWSEAAKWAQLAAPEIGGEPPLGNGTSPMILHFVNNPVPVNATTPTTFTATNDRSKVSGINAGYFAVSKLILDGGATGASGPGTNIIGSPTPGVGDPNLFFPDGGSIVNSTSHGVDYTIQNYITADLNLTLSGNGTSVVRMLQVLQPNLFVQPWSFPATLNVVKVGTSTFELPGAQSGYTTYEIREGALQTPPGNFTSGAITLGHSGSNSAILRIGTNSTTGGTLADTVDITVLPGPPGSVRTIQSLSTAANESVSLAGDLVIPLGVSLRIDTGASEDSAMSLGSNGSILSGDGDLIVCGSGRLFIHSFVDNSGFTGQIIVKSGRYEAPPAIPGGGGFVPPPTTLGGGEMVFGETNGNYTQNIIVAPPEPGVEPPSFNVTNNGILAGALTVNGGLDMTVADGKNFVFNGGLDGIIPEGQSLNLNVIGSGFVEFNGDNSGLVGTIDFGRDVGTAGEDASLLVSDLDAFPEDAVLNMYTGILAFAPPGDATSAGSIEFKAAAPGSAAPELVLLNDTPGVPKSITIEGSITYNRETLIRVDEQNDEIELEGNITNSVPSAGMEKLGPGTLSLNPLAAGLPADNFSAPIDVAEGTLEVNRNISSSHVSVANGATLTGSGTLGALTVDPGAIIAPGNSPGTLTTGPATLTGSTLNIEIDGVVADKLVSTGSLTITGTTLSVTVLAGGFTQPGYVIAQGNPLVGTFASVPVGYTVAYSATQATLSLTAAPNPYNNWIDAYNVPPVLSAADKLPTADPDRDGIRNLLEFALGGNPVVSSPSILPTVTRDGSNLMLTFKRSDASESNTTLTVEVSEDLDDWTTIPPITIGPASSGAVTVAEQGASDDNITVAVPMGTGGIRFCRLKATSTGP